MSSLCKKGLLDLAIVLVIEILLKLATKLTSSVVDKFEGNISEQGAVRVGEGFTFFISNECMNDIIKMVIISRLWADGAIETVNHKNKKLEGGFLGAIMAPMAALLIQPVFSSLINSWSGKGQESGLLPLLALPLM